MRFRSWLFLGLTLPTIMVVPFLWGSLSVLWALALYRLFRAGPENAWHVFASSWPLALVTAAWTIVGGYAFLLCAKEEEPASHQGETSEK